MTDFILGDPTLALPRAFSQTPPLRGLLRETPQDFVVEEQLGYEASGEGEHVFLTIQKTERNTADVARALAKFAGVKQVAVGFAGLKDRNAVTTQSFSVQLPGKASPDWTELEDESLKVLSSPRHGRKIKRGSLRGNHFRIRISQLSGDRAAAEHILADMAAHGLPNYFGSQRFGRDGNNLQQADDFFSGKGRRPKRERMGILISTARSYLFNKVLAQRVIDGTWDKALNGDVMELVGSKKQFAIESVDEEIASRLSSLDVHITGPMFGGDGRALVPTSEAATIENLVAHEGADWISGIAKNRVDTARRALRSIASDLSWHWHDDALELSFGLSSGCYATALLRELIDGDIS